MYFKQKIIFKNDDRYFKHPLPVQIRLTHVRVECAIILISMACQRSLILYYDVQDALLAGGQSWKRITWHPITKCQIETRKASLFLFSFISVSLNCSISACSGWVNRRIERLVFAENYPARYSKLGLLNAYMTGSILCSAFFDRFHPLKMYFVPDVVIANNWRTSTTRNYRIARSR